MLGVRPVVCLLVCCVLVSPLGQPRATAVLDRFEGERAVLVTDDGESLSVDSDRLPPEGRHAGAVFRVALAHGTLVRAAYDPRGTHRRASRSRARFERLARPLGPTGNQS